MEENWPAVTWLKLVEGGRGWGEGIDLHTELICRSVWGAVNLHAARASCTV